ncbi:hypothetical protein M758_5G008800 [Ceratodon purpureus]|nr:hypothetical protein M758_5G008800 [Ceratodon purpureus]
MPRLLLHCQLGVFFLDDDALVITQVIRADEKFLQSRCINFHGVLTIGGVVVHSHHILSACLHCGHF